MIYTEQTKMALNLCFTAHKDQKDKGGLPYVLHPVHLAEQMPDENTTIAALLHDVVEDTDITLEQLYSDGYPKEAVDAVGLLTKQRGDSYKEYIRQIKENPIARVVKLADLAHNTDFTRLNAITDKDRKRLDKYLDAIRELGGDTIEVKDGKCRYCNGLCLRPDGEHELDACQYTPTEVYRNVTVRVMARESHTG